VFVAGVTGDKYLDGHLAHLGQIGGICVSPSDDNLVYFTDKTHRRVRAIKGGVVYTVAGTGLEGDADGDALQEASFSSGLAGIAVGSYDTIYVADSLNNKIRRVADGRVSTIDSTDSPLHGPESVACAFLSRGPLYIADTKANQIKTTDYDDDDVISFAGSGSVSVSTGSLSSCGLPKPTCLQFAGRHNLYFKSGTQILKLDLKREIVTKYWDPPRKFITMSHHMSDFVITPRQSLYMWLHGEIYFMDPKSLSDKRCTGFGVGVNSSRAAVSPTSGRIYYSGDGNIQMLEGNPIDYEAHFHAHGLKNESSDWAKKLQWGVQSFGFRESLWRSAVQAF
jgi:hypothetical protein